MIVYCNPTPKAIDRGVLSTLRKSSKSSVSPMLSIMIPRKRGIHVGWNHVAVVGSHKARAAPLITHTGNALARVMKSFSILFTG